MKLFQYKKLIPAVICLLLPACGNRGEETAAFEEENEEMATNRVEIPSTVRNNLGITFAKVERRNVANTIRVPGSFELRPLAKREYRLMLPGQVEFAVNQLDEVEPGTLLYRVRSTRWLEMQSQADLGRAALEQARAKLGSVEKRIAALQEAAFKRADLDAQQVEIQADVTKREAELRAVLGKMARMLSLHNAAGKGDVSPDELLAPTGPENGAMLRYQTIDVIDVRATEPGVVESLAVTDGAFVEETTLVLTTVDPLKVRFRALGLQSDLPFFENGRSVRVVPAQAEGGEINASVEATLRIGLDAHPDQRTLTLFALPGDLQPWVRPGVSAFLEITAESSGGVVLAIPRSAVVKDGITHVFFKRDPFNANKAIRVEADLGVDDGRWVEIKSEIGPDDEVVLNGAYELKLATEMSGTSQKGGHFHADGTFHGEH